MVAPQSDANIHLMGMAVKGHQTAFMPTREMPRPSWERSGYGERPQGPQGPYAEVNQLVNRLPFPQAVRPMEETEAALPEVVATRPQPKLPSDRRLEREARGERAGPSPGSSATYSPAVEGNSPPRQNLRSNCAEDLQGENAFIMGGELSREQTAPSPMRAAPKSSAPISQTRSDDAEVIYLRKNVEHLRFAKRRLEEKVQELELRCDALEQRKQQYKLLYEQALRDQAGGGGLEISSLHQQLSAISLLKDALNQENMELSRRLEEVETHPEAVVSQVCVICMENLANLVVMPCKHLAICSFCGLGDLVECPICRTKVYDVMQIFTP